MVLFVKTKIKKSEISGKGLFAEEMIEKSTLIGNFAEGSKRINEKRYNNEQKKGKSKLSKFLTLTGSRWIGDIFLYDLKMMNEDLLNHSNNPNLLYHCGLLFAKRKIIAGEELTIDYKHILSEEDPFQFIDSQTGKLVKGINPVDSIKETSKELILLLKK